MTGPGAPAPAPDRPPAIPDRLAKVEAAGLTFAVLANPFAGRGRHRAAVSAALSAITGAGHQVRLLDARTADDALTACRAAVADGVGGLVAIGGDGTVNLVAQAAAGSGVPVGIVPVGTGNDFAAEAGVPTDPVAAAQALATALAAGRSRPFDVIRVDGPGGYQRRFVAVLGAGFDALVNERANAMRWPRGRRRYDLAIFAELVRLRPRPYRITLDGGDPIEQDAVLVAVGNTPSYGGGMRMCPAADPTDGLLDLVVAAPLSRTALLRLQPSVYHGTHVRDARLASYRARTVTIDAPSITAYADGERFCPLPIGLTVEAAALSLLV